MHKKRGQGNKMRKKSGNMRQIWKAKIDKITRCST